MVRQKRHTSVSSPKQTTQQPDKSVTYKTNSLSGKKRSPLNFNKFPLLLKIITQ